MTTGQDDMIFVIAGQGVLSKAIRDHLDGAGIEWMAFSEVESRSIAPEKLDTAIALHCGSGRELGALLDWCGRRGVPLIQASTGQAMPRVTAVPIVDTPNLALPIIRFIDLLPAVAASFPQARKSVMESHHRRKTTTPGTAVSMARAIGVADSEIVSLRDPLVQRQCGVPEEFLGAHGYHFVTLDEGGVQVTLATRINGFRPYAEGALVLARALLERRQTLHNRIYSAMELLRPQ